MGLVPGRHQAHIRQRVSLPGDFSFDVVSSFSSSPFTGEVPRLGRRGSGV
jgi:hypothetical protein